MKVTELNSDELQQLKWNIYYNGEEEAFADYAALTAEERELLNGIDYADEIPDKIIYKLYGGIDFCHDDFGNDESTDNNIVNEIMESVYGETIKK
nr:MAG TPA: hypothetical protein [Caudoviricetes sp.]